MGGGRDQALSSRDWGDSLAVLMIIAALAIPLINPVGYVGGGHDDSHYLDAARCWVEPSVAPQVWARQGCRRWRLVSVAGTRKPRRGYCPSRQALRCRPRRRLPFRI